jgi:hypothetical protein
MPVQQVRYNVKKPSAFASLASGVAGGVLDRKRAAAEKQQELEKELLMQSVRNGDLEVKQDAKGKFTWVKSQKSKIDTKTAVDTALNTDLDNKYGTIDSLYKIITTAPGTPEAANATKRLADRTREYQQRQPQEYIKYGITEPPTESEIKKINDTILAAAKASDEIKKKALIAANLKETFKNQNNNPISMPTGTGSLGAMIGQGVKNINIPWGQIGQAFGQPQVAGPLTPILKGLGGGIGNFAGGIASQFMPMAKPPLPNSNPNFTNFVNAGGGF